MLLQDVLGPVADGQAIQVIPVQHEISTQEAANLLNVSRPYLVKLLESGELPYRKVGPRRRIHLEDVLAYKLHLDSQRQEALKALADDLQDMENS
ncbi:hypothetical protein Dxin01_01763 [Deinococcus xinjiangensis]|uniref:Helix-turn-helix domain-containing protein n=2 Tax=Deinococcus xinjiangensis TaxID=457454 RepID=A0ABP9V9R9_9DEIO